MGSTKDQVQVSYDVSNEFFRLWLDERMNYTSAVFESTEQSLEAAQLNKLRILSDFAHVTPDEQSARHRLRLGRQPRVPRHHARREERVRRHALQRADGGDQPPQAPGREGVLLRLQGPRARGEVRRGHLHLHDRPPVLARRGAAGQGGRHLPQVLQEVHQWTAPGAWFGLQHILRNRVPARQEGPGGRPLGHARDLPGRAQPAPRGSRAGGQPVLGDRRDAHAGGSTTGAPRRVAQAAARPRSADSQKWGDQVFEDYDRYLSTCVTASTSTTRRWRSTRSDESTRIGRRRS